VNTTVHNNVIIAGTVNSTAGSKNYGIRVRRSGNKIYNNTIYGPYHDGCLRLEDGPHDVRNNILLNCGGSAIGNYSTGSTILNNLTSGKATDVFVNPEAGDFTLKADIGVGATITGTSTTTSTVLNSPATPGSLQAVAQ
jgi:hypothetical protein